MQGGHNIALHQCERCRKVLTCPGNVVGGAKHQQRCCWDMEALFSSFHIGKGGVGVAGGYCGLVWPFGGVLEVWAWRWVHCCQRLGTVKTPQIDDYKVWEALWGWWGVGMVVGMVVGFAAWVCRGCGGWCDRYFIARVHKNEKRPCKHWFTGLVVISKSS